MIRVLQTDRNNRIWYGWYLGKRKRSHSVVSNSLWPHGLKAARLLHPGDFPGKSTGVGCYFLLQGIPLTQGLNLGLPALSDTLLSETPGKRHSKTNCCKFTEQIIICLKSRPTNTWSLPRSAVLQECSYKDFFYTLCKTYHYKIIALFKLQFNICWKNMAKKAAFRRIHQVVLTPKSLGKKSCLMTVFFLISNYAFPNWSILVTLL